jgi:hypothetical protein
MMFARIHGNIKIGIRVRSSDPRAVDSEPRGGAGNRVEFGVILEKKDQRFCGLGRRLRKRALSVFTSNWKLTGPHPGAPRVSACADGPEDNANRSIAATGGHSKPPWNTRNSNEITRCTPAALRDSCYKICKGYARKTRKAEMI